MQKVWSFAVAAVAAIMSGAAGEPAQDMTEKCMSCEAQMQSMYDTWTNETTVAQILADLQSGCEAYPSVKKEICDALAVSNAMVCGK